MIYPNSFEQKIGFTTVREMVKSHCVSSLGIEYCNEMSFSTRYDVINRWLCSTAEMQNILTGEEPIPLGNIHDVTTSLKAIRVPGTFIPAPELLKVRQSLGAINEISAFFAKNREDDTTPYPILDKLAQSLSPFPHITSAIDRVLDRFGNIKDNASPELATIRQSLASTTGTINSIMRRVMLRAQQSGYIEADTTPSMRDGRLVIPVAPMHKRKINGIVHDESASGKTIFIEPAEIVEANNRILTVYNVHLRSFGFTGEDKQFYNDLTTFSGKEEFSQVKPKLISKLNAAARHRARQARLLKAHIDKTGGNIIVCGDFNDTPNCYAIRTISGDCMHDAYVENAFGPTITYNADRFYFRIDHVLYKGALDAVNIERGSQDYSDHYPLLTTFLWQEN